jgi:hypothetical protein
MPSRRLVLTRLTSDEEEETKENDASISALTGGMHYKPRNSKGGSITVPLTSCLTGLESAV